MARTYTLLTASNIPGVCSYLLPNSVQCPRPVEWAVNDTGLPANYQNYQVCHVHFNILKATDSSLFTPSGNQRNDQTLNSATCSDDINGFWTAGTKDSKNKGFTQKTYVSEVNHP